MSNNMCSLENGVTNHSMPPIVSSQSFNCSSLPSKPFASHLFGSIPLHSSHTAFPFPPNPLFLSSLFNHSSQSWFTPHNSLNTPLSLTTNDSKDVLQNSTNDNNNNIHKNDKYKDSTKQLITHNNINSPEKSDLTSVTTDSSVASNPSNLSMNDSERTTNRSHSDNLNWLAEVAISSRGIQSSPSGSAHLVLPLSHHSSQRSLYHTTIANDISNQRLYSPRFGSSTSPSFFSYPPPNSPLNAMNSVRPPPPTAHFGAPFMSNYNSYQQFSPTTAQNTISPFLVPNQSSVTNTRNGTYPTGIIDSYHQNNAQHSQNAILSASVNSCSIPSQSGVTTNSSRSPSLHSSDSSSMISSGPFSSPNIRSESPEHQTKSMMRSIKDPLQSPNDISVMNDANKSTYISTGIKRKSPISPEINNNDNEKNIYKLPFGREGSRKHRILKPPNISIVDKHFESAPLSAPPIPRVRREEFVKRISDSDIASYSNQSIAHQNNCHNSSTLSHQRRKSVPQTSPHKTLKTFTAKENSIQDRHYSIPNENSVPIEEHNHLQYPIYFQKGSIIQLGNGKVKPVEEMSTQDFIESATRSSDLCADCSEVIKMDDKMKSCSTLLSFSVGRNKFPVTVEAPVEHPFFVFHKGWSSCSPEKSLVRYGLKCRKLKIGDVCVSLTPKTTNTCNTNGKRLIDSEKEMNAAQPDSLVSNQNLESDSKPISLVKCSAHASSLKNGCQRNQNKKSELLEGKVVNSSSNSSSSSSSSSSVSAVPTISSVNSQLSHLNQRNRRHSAPDNIESEPSKAS